MESDFLPKVVLRFHCESCNYSTSRKTDYDKHILTLKHKTIVQKAFLAINGNEKNSTNVAIYNCRVCNFNTKNKRNYDNHLLTEKHKNKINEDKSKEIKHICCQCSKEYLNYSGLWKHKKNCIPINNEREPEELQNTFTPTNLTKELFFEVLKESKELQQVLIEQNKELQNKLLEQNNKLLEKDNILIEQNNKIIELASKQGSNNTINSNNKTNNFNLQLFLNETCKDAMNIVDFINSLKLTTDDFETTGRLGFIDGISRIIIKELKKLETEKLPIHCTDFKRETVYIKDNNIWEKENEEKKKLKWTIDKVAQMNLNLIQDWQEEFPECKENNTKENQHFFKLASVALGGRGKDEEDKYREKIMKNVLKEVVLDKK